VVNRRNKRVIVVTGASRGLGREIALRFGRAGERVVLNFLNSEADVRTVGELVRGSGGEPIIVRADVREPPQVEALVARVRERWGRVDVLVNNAGVTRDGLALRMSEEDWDTVLETDLKGAFVCMRAVARMMTEMRSGHIISIASISGVHGREGQANYSAAKSGLIGLTKAAARELGGCNIRVNAVLPGYLATTKMGQKLSPAFAEWITRENVLGRSTTPEEVAEFIYQLSLMENVSGQVFTLDSSVL
jgi:3-oxoacyl-[acyl-carrier protein] reductase